MYAQKGGLEAAVAAATKIDASLHAKGKLAKNLSEGLCKGDVLKLIQVEFSINHVSQCTRNLLCRGSTQELIKDYSGACVSTKGRYIPESERKNLNCQEKSIKSLGLYLFIQGPTHRSVDLAIQKIEDMIAANCDGTNHRNGANGGVSTMVPVSSTGNMTPSASINAPVRAQIGGNAPPALMSRSVQLPPPIVEQSSGKFVEKIRIGMENILPGFNLTMKLIGQNCSNLNYIKNETGATVTLRGIGSSYMEPGTQQEAPEPLHFCIMHHKPEVVATARDLALNLIATVQQEYAQFQMQQPPPQTIPTQIQQINVESPPNLMLHQPGNGEHPIIQQPIPNVLSTSIALPVVQTGFIQQPAVTQLTAPPPIVGVPPPHFSQPPPAQVALPPPGVHIPQQQGPLVPPPAPQHLQLQPQAEPPGNFVQQVAQPFQPGQPAGQQQYVITQNGQPMQGIMTSQGLVVLNQQTQPTYAQQQVFLSQPPPIGPAQPVFQSNQPLTFQTPAPGQPLHAAVSVPVSYQFQYVQQNPPPTMTYSPVQNPIQAQPSHIQIQPPQQHPLPQTQIPTNPLPNPPSGQSPSQPNVSQPPPSLSNQSPNIQNPPPTQRHSPNVQAPPPNQSNPPFAMQPAQNQMLLQQLPNHQLMQNNQSIPLHGQNIQTIPISTASFIPAQPQLMQIQNVRPPNELQTHFQIPQQHYGQYQQQVVMKPIQVCQPQQLQFMPGCPPGPIQILPATSGQFMPVQHLPPTQFHQNQDSPQEPKPPKRKFTEELPPANQQGPTPPQSLMSIPMQPPQPVPPPAQSVSSNSSARQGVGVQELMIMNQQQRRQHMQQPEGLQKDPSQKGEESSHVPPPPSSTGAPEEDSSCLSFPHQPRSRRTRPLHLKPPSQGNSASFLRAVDSSPSALRRPLTSNQQNFGMVEDGTLDAEKGNQRRQFAGFDENQREGHQEGERERDERNCGYRRDKNRDRPTFSHYSSKPQMYDTQMAQHPVLGIGMCPPPPPPPPHLMSQPQGGAQAQGPGNHYYQSNRPY